MMIRGRHRGLPYELDRAILLPSESLTAKEALEAEKQAMRRRGSGLSNMSAVTGVANPAPFRPETGLYPSNTLEHVPTQGLDRSRTNQSGGSHFTHHSHARTGLGNVMFNIAGHTDLPNPTGSEKDDKQD